MKKIAVFASGSGTNAENISRYFVDNQNIKVVLTVSNNPLAGVHARMNQFGIPSATFTNEECADGDQVVKKLAEYQVDWIILAGYLRKIPDTILNAYPDKIINIHPALLPKHGGKGMYGMRVHEAVVAADESESGITIHYINENYDEGPIIFQTTCPVLPSDTPEEVAIKVHILEYKHYPEVIEETINKYYSMKQFSTLCKLIFDLATVSYHEKDDVDVPVDNPFDKQNIKYYLFLKGWTDAVQWHLEDMIRHPDIKPEKALSIKRRIDTLNQERTDLVEWIDNYLLNLFKDVRIHPDATVNTESPAWAIDRLSILMLKTYHWEQEYMRKDADETHKQICTEKLHILHEQKKDLSTAIDQLLDDIKDGKKHMKVYKQMKMYNDPSFNPVLYKNKHG